MPLRAKRLPTMVTYKVNVAKGALASYGEKLLPLGRFSPSMSIAFFSAPHRRSPGRAARQAPLLSSISRPPGPSASRSPQSVLVRADEVIE